MSRTGWEYIRNHSDSGAGSSARKTIGRSPFALPVRSGLVLLGAIIAVLGGGLIVTLFVLSGGPTTASQLRFENPNLAPHQVWSEGISRTSSAEATIGLSWAASGPANVTLTPARECLQPVGLCPSGSPIFNWTGVLSGKATDSSSNATSFLLDVTDAGDAAVRFSAVVSVSYQPGGSTPDWAWGLIALGGVVLLAIGGIAVFLGLFLPGGVYERANDDEMLRRPPGLPPEDPDAEEPPP